MLVVVTVVGCGGLEDEEEAVLGETNLKAYLPLRQGMVFDFDGEGVAFPSLEREVMFVREPYFQVLDRMTGTNIVKVYKVSEDEIGLVFEEGEFYSEENLLDGMDKESEVEEIILKKPVEPGNSWETDNRKREITSVGKTVTVPAGTFYDVVEVKSAPLDEEGIVNYYYYAKNIGLVKRESFDDEGNRLTILELGNYKK